MDARTRYASLIACAALLLGLLGCSTEAADVTPASDPAEVTTSDADNMPGAADSDTPAEDANVAGWVNLELTDAETGETFTLGDLSGTPVYIQAFAVW